MNMYLLDVENVMNMDTYLETAHKTKGRIIREPTQAKILMDSPRWEAEGKEEEESTRNNRVKTSYQVAIVLKS